MQRKSLDQLEKELSTIRQQRRKTQQEYIRTQEEYNKFQKQNEPDEKRIAKLRKDQKIQSLLNQLNNELKSRGQTVEIKPSVRKTIDMTKSYTQDEQNDHMNQTAQFKQIYHDPPKVPQNQTSHQQPKKQPSTTQINHSEQVKQQSQPDQKPTEQLIRKSISHEKVLEPVQNEPDNIPAQTAVLEANPEPIMHENAPEPVIQEQAPEPVQEQPKSQLDEQIFDEQIHENIYYFHSQKDDSDLDDLMKDSDNEAENQILSPKQAENDDFEDSQIPEKSAPAVCLEKPEETAEFSDNSPKIAKQNEFDEESEKFIDDDIANPAVNNSFSDEKPAIPVQKSHESIKIVRNEELSESFSDPYENEKKQREIAQAENLMVKEEEIVRGSVEKEAVVVQEKKQRKKSSKNLAKLMEGAMDDDKEDVGQKLAVEGQISGEKPQETAEKVNNEEMSEKFSNDEKEKKVDSQEITMPKEDEEKTQEKKHPKKKAKNSAKASTISTRDTDDKNHSEDINQQDTSLNESMNQSILQSDQLHNSSEQKKSAEQKRPKKTKNILKQEDSPEINLQQLNEENLPKSRKSNSKHTSKLAESVENSVVVDDKSHIEDLERPQNRPQNTKRKSKVSENDSKLNQSSLNIKTDDEAPEPFTQSSDKPQKVAKKPKKKKVEIVDEIEIEF